MRVLRAAMRVLGAQPAATGLHGRLFGAFWHKDSPTPRMKTHFSPSLLAWLRVFEAVSRTGSFTEAAKVLHVTQGAVSQQIKLLEAWADTGLLDRRSRGTPRRIHLTPKGQSLSAALHSSFQLLDDALSQLREEPPLHPIDLVCSPSFAMHWLMPRMGRFFQRYPEIPLRLQAEVLAQANFKILPASVDAAIIYAPLETDNRQATTFLDETIFPVASPDFLKNHPEIRRPEDMPPTLLLHDDCAWPTAGPQSEWHSWLEFAGVHIPKLHLGQHFNLSQLTARAAVAGQGIAMGRTAIILDDLIAGRLVDIFHIHAPSVAGYHFLCNIDNPKSVDTLLHWLRDEAEKFRRDRERALKSANG